MTTRKTMALIALLGLVMAALLWLPRRRQEFLRLMDGHHQDGIMIVQRHRLPIALIDGADQQTAARILRGRTAADRRAFRLTQHHRALWGKYAVAAERPWLPVAPDPPTPE